MIDEQQLNQLNIKRGVSRRLKKPSFIIAVCAFVVIVALGGVVVWRTWYFYTLVKKGSEVRLAREGGFTVSPRAQGLTPASLGEGQADRQWAPIFGAGKNALTIVQFADFECPFSRETYSTVRELMNAHAGDVHFVFRYFPILELHAHALKASEAAACANDQRKFWAYHDKLYQNQTRLEDADLKRYATEAGLARVPFDACLDGGVHYKEIMQDYQDGTRLGVRGTPTFFVSGQKVEGVLSLAEWEKLLAYFKK